MAKEEGGLKVDFMIADDRGLDDVVPVETVTGGRKTKEKAPRFKVGDAVFFKGGHHYRSAAAKIPTKIQRDAGPAKIEKKQIGRNPFYVIAVNRQGCPVWGWVQEEQLEARK